MKLEIGQRIDVYKIIKDGGFKSLVFKIGSIRPEVIKTPFESTFKRLMTERKNFVENYLSMKEGTECVKVGTMIITKLK